MSRCLAAVLQLLWLAWVVQAALAVLQVRRLLVLLRRPVRRKYLRHRPPASVVIPVKGLDDDLAAHVVAMCRQDYPDYELLYVVESTADPAWSVLRDLLDGQRARPWRLLVAGIAGPDRGQKIHNQLCALAVLDRESDDRRVWVFADSDVVPGPQWLACLVRPTRRRDRVGMATGYRWLLPAAPPGRRPSLWSHVASVANSSVACQLGRSALNHAWGGSMALTAEVARRGDLQAHLASSVTDDYQATRMCRRLGLRIAFVPQCLVPSPAGFDLAGLWGFGRRQYLITRVYVRGVYLAALGITGLYVAGFLSAVCALLAAAGGRGRWVHPAAAAAAVFGLDQIRATLRARAVAEALGPAARRRLRATLRVDRWLTPLWMGVHWLIVLSALCGRTIRWRGVRYQLRGPAEVRRLD